MAGTVLPVHPKTNYRFLAAQFPASQTITLPLAVNVNITEWRQAMLVVRVHGAPTWAGGASFRYDFFPSAPSPDDPSILFRDTTGTPSIQITSAQVGSSTSYLGISSVSSGLGGYGDLLVTFIQTGLMASDLFITLSCDLILKD